MATGARGRVKVSVERSGAQVEITTERRPTASLDLRDGWTYDLPGPAFRRLSPEVAYLKLSAVKTAEIPEYLRAAEGRRDGSSTSATIRGRSSSSISAGIS